MRNSQTNTSFDLSENKMKPQSYKQMIWDSRLYCILTMRLIILKTINDKKVLTSDVHYILYCPLAIFSYVLVPAVSLLQILNSVFRANEHISQTWPFAATEVSYILSSHFKLRFLQMRDQIINSGISTFKKSSSPLHVIQMRLSDGVSHHMQLQNCGIDMYMHVWPCRLNIMDRPSLAHQSQKGSSLRNDGQQQGHDQPAVCCLTVKRLFPQYDQSSS